MRRITLAIMSTVAALVLLFSYRTSTAGPRTGATATAGAAPAGVVDGAARQESGGSVVVNGTVSQTRWGPVQVRAVIAAGRITDVLVLLQPTGNRRDEVINARALPQLRDQVIAAQSARIDGVSGATVTTDGYTESLQAALDAAHFGS